MALKTRCAITVMKSHWSSMLMCMCCSIFVAFGAMALLPPLMFSTAEEMMLCQKNI